MSEGPIEGDVFGFGGMMRQAERQHDRARMRAEAQRERMYRLIDELPSEQLAILRILFNNMTKVTANYVEGMCVQELRRRHVCPDCGEQSHELAATACTL